MKKQPPGERLIKLSIRHAEISEQIKTNEEQRQVEMGYCKGAKDEGGIYYYNCFEMAYKFTKESREHQEGISFDEMLENYGCRHCISARSLKRHIGKLKQDRGRIHSALTNIGKTLYHLKDNK